MRHSEMLALQATDAGGDPEPGTIAALPGPPRLPLVGNAHQLLRTERLHQTAEAWARRYGPILRIDIGPRRIVAIGDADAINEILRDRPQGFRRLRDMREVIMEMGPPGVFAAEGEDWKRQRRLVVTALNTHHIRRYFDLIRISAERLPGRLREAARDGHSLAIGAELASYTVDITAALALGHDLNTLERRDNELQGHLHRVMEMTSRRLAAPVPYWRRIRLPADRALDRSLAEMHRAVAEFIAMARARMEAEPERYEEPPNLLEAMLAAQREEGTFSEDEIVGNVFTILLAGEDTTAHTLGWTIWLLASRPEIQARLATEAEAALSGDGPLPLSFESIEQLPYTEAVLQRVDAPQGGGPGDRCGADRGDDDLRHPYPGRDPPAPAPPPRRDHHSRPQRRVLSRALARGQRRDAGAESPGLRRRPPLLPRPQPRLPRGKDRAGNDPARLRVRARRLRRPGHRGAQVRNGPRGLAGALASAVALPDRRELDARLHPPACS